MTRSQVGRWARGVLIVEKRCGSARPCTAALSKSNKRRKRMSAVSKVPLIGNRILKRIKPGNFFGIVRNRGTIGDHSGLSSNAFKAVPDAGWNGKELIIIFP